MGRKPRSSNTGNYYHVMVQGFNKGKIFIQDSFKIFYLKSIQALKEKWKIDILAYCIMTTHAHMLIYCEDITKLSGFMKALNVSFSGNYNKVNSRNSFVFRDRFKSEPIENERHLLNCLVYIHKNPVKAKMVKECKDYNFSSYNEYLNKFKIVSEKSIERLFHFSKDYEKIFLEYHNSDFDKDNDVIFMDEKVELKEYLNEYLEMENLEFSVLFSDKNKIKDFIKKARKLTTANMREIGELFNLSESKCHRLIRS